MVIFTQNGDLVNFDKICKVGSYGIDFEGGGEELVALVGLTSFDESNDIENDGTNIVLGIYDNQDKCDAVVFELMEAFAIGKHVYQMPVSTDDEASTPPPYNDEAAEAAAEE